MSRDKHSYTDIGMKHTNGAEYPRRKSGSLLIRGPGLRCGQLGAKGLYVFRLQTSLDGVCITVLSYHCLLTEVLRRQDPGGRLARSLLHSYSQVSTEILASPTCTRCKLFTAHNILGKVRGKCYCALCPIYTGWNAESGSKGGTQVS